MEWTHDAISIEPAPHLTVEGLLGILDNSEASDVERGIAATDLAWLQRCQQGQQLQVSCLRIGDAQIIHLPGEAVVEYQLFAQGLKPEDFVAVAAYGDYGTGYICLEKHYSEGGYEASERASRVAPSTEHGLKNAIRTVLAIDNVLASDSGSEAEAEAEVDETK